MIAFLNDLIWGKVLIFTLVPIGLYFTVRSGFVQFRYFFRMFSVLGQGFAHKTGQPTSFQALALSVAGRVGAGNIAGVAVALTLGGPGAIFWMWIVGIVGMATSFFECSLAQLFKRREPDGKFRGGPAWYIEKGLGPKLGGGATIMAAVYSVLLLAAFGFAFIMLQSYAVTTSVSGAFSIPPAVSAAVLSVLVGIVIFGGVGRITSVVEIVVPVMAFVYIAVVLVIVVMRIDDVPRVLGMIVSEAFGPSEAVAGGIGAVLIQGVRRGLFSNEAGLGSAPNAAAVAYVDHPGQQGVVQSLSVFIDTILLCTCTALIILLSGIDLTNPDQDGVILTQLALADHIGPWAESVLALALFLFVFSSIMYNYYLGETAVDYFAKARKLPIMIYRVVVIGLVFVGAFLNLSSAFGFADVAMGLLALVNLLALVLLFPIGLRIMRDMDEQFKTSGALYFDIAKYDDLDIDESAWLTLDEELRTEEAEAR